MRPRGAAQRVVEPRMRELCSAMCRTVAAAHEGSVSDVYWDVTVYAKNVVESIPPSVLRKIREEIDG